MFRKRFLLLSLVVVLGFSLAACGGFAPAAEIGLILSTGVPIRTVVSAQAGIQAADKVTLTPFQASSPTPWPTLTQTPTQVPSPTQPPCLDQPGQIQAMSEVVRDGHPPLVFRVYFPPCFSENQAARYPVLYMIHGQASMEDQWERLGVGEAADELIHEGETPPFLIVMPQEKDTYEDIYQTEFGEDIVNGLVPWIDAAYSTCADRSCRAIGGLSRGGAWALHLGFTRWDLFGAIGMHSTPPFNTDPGLFPTWLKSIPPDQLPRVWMDSGRRDAFLSYSSAFEAEMVQYGVPHEWYLFNGMHEESYWKAHVAEYLEWYSRPWKDLPQKLLTR